MGTFARLNAALYDRLTARFERDHGAAMRAKQLAPAHGRVLEFGAGTGANLEHYPAGVAELVATEPNQAMLARARRRAPGPSVPASLVQAGAEALPFPDDSFDVAACTLVLCTIPDPAAALHEIRRVLRPGGTLHFVEHGLAPDRGVRRWQHGLEPLWEPVAGGCHLSRPIDDLVSEAGFRLERLERFYGAGPKPIAYFYLGYATSTA